METVNWERCPSVRYGDKLTFLTAQTSKGRFWVVWNRLQNNYVVDHARPFDSNEILAYVTTEAQGKRVVADYLKKHS